ncbi:MAG: hypothetical protein ACI91B_004153 [Planctomycetota bacterium]
MVIPHRRGAFVPKRVIALLIRLPTVDLLYPMAPAASIATKPVFNSEGSGMIAILENGMIG